MRFDKFFVATPVCSPSRATFLTGRIPSQHGVHDWIREGNVGDSAAAYLAGEVAYTDILADNGWVCGLSGKWHLGHSQLAQHGFSHWYVHQQGGGPYNDAPMIRDGELITEPGYVTTAITNDALAFIDQHTDGDAPFYLGVHYTAPHSPWTGHPQEDRRFLRQLRVRLLSARGDPPLGRGTPAKRKLSGQPRDAQGLFCGGDGHGPRHRTDSRQAGGTGDCARTR